MQMKLFLKYLFFILFFLSNFNFEIYIGKAFDKVEINELENGK